MQAEIITIGDELLIGQTVNTNASWLGQALSNIGVRIAKSTSIQDDAMQIRTQLDSSLKSVDLVILTGGLGPTKDDITKVVLNDFFGGTLVLNQEVLHHVEAFFTKRNRPMLEVNRYQAMVPDCCEVLFNSYGTAPGMWFSRNGKTVISMPGVPYEMKGLVNDVVLPRLLEKFDLKGIYYRSIHTCGIGESFLADLISDWENKVRELDLGLAYLPSPGTVKLRLTSYRGKEDKTLIDTCFDELIARIPTYYVGEENEDLSFVVGKLLRSTNATVGTVESCTVGGIAAELVKTPGASAYFEGSLLAYSYDLKEKLVGVQHETLTQFGAVSQQCIEEMAVNGREKLHVDYCVASSGIAGPDGGTPEKPVGTVWLALAYPGGVYCKKFQFGTIRSVNTQLAVMAALNLLRLQLIGKLDKA